MNPPPAVNGQRPTLPTILGQTPMRFPVGGKIRAGIKVLTKAAANHPRAREIYERGVAAGRDFDAIEKDIAQAVPELKTPLTPRNVSYFTARRSDFAMPEVADKILYGEDRGDGVKRLYRFPVVFPADAWQAVMPHALMCYGSSQLKYWSEYSQDGRNRHCMTHEPVPVDGNSKRVIRLFGGRKRVLRPENQGRCDPESCREYQTRQCNLSGRFIFLIPGIPSIRAIELSTHSFYSMAAARETLETVALLRGGRISGFLEGKTSFWITKELREIAMIGEDGEPRRVEQWLIKLEAPVDLTRLLRVDDDEARTSQAERAVGLLTGATAVHEPDAVDAVATNENCEPGEPATNVGSTASTAPIAEDVPPQRVSPPAAETSQGPPERRAIDEALGQLFELIDAMQIPREPFERYAKKKYGPGWSGNPYGIRRVRAEVDPFRDNADGFRKKIDSELDVFA